MTNKQRLFNEQVENMKKLMLEREGSKITNEQTMFTEQLANVKKLMLGTDNGKPTATKSVIRESFSPLPVSNEPELKDIAMETEINDEPDPEMMNNTSQPQTDNGAPDQATLMQMAQHYADTMYAKYIDPASLNFEGDGESWYFNFNINIPKNEMQNVQTADDVEGMLGNEINYSSHGAEGNPGGEYRRSGIRDVQDGGDYWVVQIGSRGGMDV